MVSITDIGKEREKNGSLIPEITLSGKLYYDTIVNPIYDEQGQLVGVYTAGRSINEMVESYHRQQEGTRQLKEMTQQMQEYIDNINIALRVSEVRLMNYLPDTHEVEISNDLNTKKLRLTQIRCFTLVSPEHRHQLATMIRQMDRRVDTRIDMTVRSTLRDHQGRDIWLTFSLIPMKRDDNSVSHYFGMCRNETEMVSTAALLKEESRKAQETELLKDAFLQNMSYEIRTPLSAVLGFAELLNSDHSADEETVFIDQIKKNANLLLQLVNDILFISRLDAHMLEIKKEPTDFAMLFDGWCHQGWARHKAEVTTSIDNPYEHLIVDIDDTNLSLVINRLCANAAAMTTEGVIRAKYEYRGNQIIINIQDTGNGFNEDESKQLFERFAKDRGSKDNNTGLALPIAKGLVEQMGGTIDFRSEPGKGSIAWVTIPATAIMAERKDLSTTA
jgi:signal transduction histidine kinase